MISIPTYSLLELSTDELPPPASSLSPAPLAEDSHHFRPSMALIPKDLTPTSPRMPIVPPAARQDKPQQRPAANCQHNIKKQVKVSFKLAEARILVS